MEKLQSLLLCFSFLSLSLASNPTDNFLINCSSTANTTVGMGVFVHDQYFSLNLGKLNQAFTALLESIIDPSFTPSR
ncbi:hypothetical protein AMTRI_Chr02g261720 [Amborella trichopoda]